MTSPLISLARTHYIVVHQFTEKGTGCPVTSLHYDLVPGETCSFELEFVNLWESWFMSGTISLEEWLLSRQPSVLATLTQYCSIIEREKKTALWFLLQHSMLPSEEIKNLLLIKYFTGLLWEIQYLFALEDKNRNLFSYFLLSFFLICGSSQCDNNIATCILCQFFSLTKWANKFHRK